MATPAENKRTDSIRVRLSPEMMERFEKLASRYGMPPATLCAFAVARFVQSEESNFSNARMAILDATRRAGENINDEQIEALLLRGLPGLAQALSQPNLPLDGEAASKDA